MSTTGSLGRLRQQPGDSEPIVSVHAASIEGIPCVVRVHEPRLEAYATSKQSVYLLVEQLRLVANDIAKRYYKSLGRPVGRHNPGKDFRYT